MFSNIKTSKTNKELVSRLTNKLNLGAENIVARMALVYSLGQGRYLDLTQIQDSSGKEYSIKVLFGDYVDYYMAMICVHYSIYKTDKDLLRYIKMHIDDGLKLIDEEISDKHKIFGIDFLINEIEKGLLSI